MHISVNDEIASVNMSDLNSRAGYHKVVPVRLTLKPGDVNSIRLGAFGTSGTSLFYLNCTL